MSNVTKKRKIQVVEFPKVDTIKKYDNFQNNNVMTPSKTMERIKNTQIVGVNKVVVNKALVYMGILLVVALGQMWMTYEVSNLGSEKSKIDKKVAELKLEVESLENMYISNFDLKQVEKKSKEMGFVHNDSLKYVKIDK